MEPPAPFRQVDLLKIARNRFRFPSNRLDYVANALGFGNKKNTTHELWIKCMNNDPKAWEEMEEYNKHDVCLLEKVYDKFKPWIRNHPNHNLYSEGSMVCPNCGHSHVQKRGYTYTAVSKYQRYKCFGCGNWFRGSRSVSRIEARNIL
jgi:DNA-directed RNA polymerase subunit RPC12/RpoP